MTMDESRFRAIADTLLQDIVDAVDDAVGDLIDVDLQGGVVTIDMGEGHQYVVNKQTPMRQIWLASPVSGAWHFAFDEASGSWRSTRDASAELRALLAAEIGQATGKTVAL